jgi:hypothetical protein
MTSLGSRHPSVTTRLAYQPWWEPSTKKWSGSIGKRYADGAFRIAFLHDPLGFSEAPGADDDGKTTGLVAHLDPDLYHLPSYWPYRKRALQAANPAVCLSRTVLAPLTPTLQGELPALDVHP